MIQAVAVESIQRSCLKLSDSLLHLELEALDAKAELKDEVLQIAPNHL